MASAGIVSRICNGSTRLLNHAVRFRNGELPNKPTELSIRKVYKQEMLHRYLQSVRKLHSESNKGSKIKF